MCFFNCQACVHQSITKSDLYLFVKYCAPWLYLDKDQAQNQDQGSDYSDDFVESGDDEYLDDFEDDSPMNGSLKKPLSIASTNDDTDDAELDYPDDFEEDSDEEEVLWIVP